MHTLDHRGDVILVLYPTATPPTTATATPPPKTKTKKRKRKPARDVNEPIARFRVSSKHLCAASPVFKAMIEGPWVETKGTPDEPKEIRVSEFDPDALHLVLRLMHYPSKGYRVPKYVCGDFDWFFDIAAVCDYYQCAGLLKRQEFKNALRRDNFVLSAAPYDEDRLARALIVSLIFRNDNAFRLATGAFIQHNRGEPLKTTQPLPKKLVEKLEQTRIERIGEFVNPFAFDPRATIRGTFCLFSNECHAAQSRALSQIRRKAGLSEDVALDVPIPFRGRFDGMNASEALANLAEAVENQPDCASYGIGHGCMVQKYGPWKTIHESGKRWRGFGLRDYSK